MYLCYVDESGDTGLRGSKHLVLSGAAIFEGKWRYLSNEIASLLTRYFPSSSRPREIHCTEIRRGAGTFSSLNRSQRISLLNEFCDFATSQREVEVTFFSVVLEKAAWFAENPGKAGRDLYLAAFEQLVARFDLYLKRLAAEGRPNKGVLVVDEASSSLAAALKGALGQFQTAGTRWHNIENVIETVLFLASHESPGLQLADLVAFSTWRFVEYSDRDLLVRIASRFDREPHRDGQISRKLHGFKYIGTAGAISQDIRIIWP